MSDRTLLENAARAAGYEWQDEFWNASHIRTEHRTWKPWSPLEDDGDEARLESVLGLDVTWQSQHVIVGTGLIAWQEPYHLHNGDKQKARRYAGVRAAAAIGEGLK